MDARFDFQQKLSYITTRGPNTLIDESSGERVFARARTPKGGLRPPAKDKYLAHGWHMTWNLQNVTWKFEIGSGELEVGAMKLQKRVP